jgi:hypothetical protein
VGRAWQRQRVRGALTSRLDQESGTGPEATFHPGPGAVRLVVVVIVSVIVAEVEHVEQITDGRRVQRDVRIARFT